MNWDLVQNISLSPEFNNRSLLQQKEQASDVRGVNQTCCEKKIQRKKSTQLLHTLFSSKNTHSPTLFFTNENSSLKGLVGRRTYQDKKHGEEVDHGLHVELPLGCDADGGEEGQAADGGQEELGS